MASKSRKDDYTDLEKELDIEEFRESVLNYFSKIPDPRQSRNLTYKIEHLFFIILSAVLGHALIPNAINKVTFLVKVRSRFE